MRSALMSLLASAALCLPLGASAQTGWSYSFTPYVFALGLKGDLATLPPARPMHVDIPFSDILENLDIALMGIGEARKGPFALWGDLFFSRLSADAKTRDLLYSGADYEQTLALMTAGVSYRLTERPAWSVDAVLGLRYANLDNDFELEAGTLPKARIKHDEDWLDPMLGFRARLKLDSDWRLSGWVYGSVGGDSNSSWDLFGGIGYALSDTSTLVGGYRHLAIDYESGDFLFDAELAGPMLGVKFAW